MGQVSCEYEAKEDNMRIYLTKTQEFVKKLPQFDITHLSWSKNQQADVLTRMASSTEGLGPRTIMWDVLHQPNSNAKEKLVLKRSFTWMDEVVKYLRDGVLPKYSKEAELVKHKSGWFLWHEDQLYKKILHPS